MDEDERRIDWWKVGLCIMVVLLIVVGVALVAVNGIKDYERRKTVCNNFGGFYKDPGLSHDKMINDIEYLECCIMIKQIDGSYKEECDFYRGDK